MKVFAQYRLPYADYYTRIEQTEGQPQQLFSCSELNGKQGFVVAPFELSERLPILLFRPDRVEEIPVSHSLYQSPRIVSKTLSRDVYSSGFEHFHSQLENGSFRKIVLSRSAVFQLADVPDAQQLFLKACSLYPRLFIALVSLPDNTCWLTATPEILLEGIGHNWRTIALAGTMQLQGEDLKSEGETMRWSTKNIQEQRYVATYIADCLERFLAQYSGASGSGVDCSSGISGNCRLGFSEDGPRTVRAANLVHLRSDFTFSLQDENPAVGTLLDLLHPTPAVCGLPKDETFRYIVDNEGYDRQYYSGFMGPLGFNGETHLYVSLRCMQIQRHFCRLYAGGGLLRDSQLEQEWQETEAKMQTMLRLLEA